MSYVTYWPRKHGRGLRLHGDQAVRTYRKRRPHWPHRPHGTENLGHGQGPSESGGVVEVQDKATPCDPSAPLTCPRDKCLARHVAPERSTQSFIGELICST